MTINDLEITIYYLNLCLSLTTGEGELEKLVDKLIMKLNKKKEKK